MSMGSQIPETRQIALLEEDSAAGVNFEQQYVVFSLDEEEYAVDILMVQEIIRWTGITRVPRAPAFIKGVLNLRGTVVPVIDSHLRFRLSPQKVTEDSRIIVFKLEDSVIGLTVDYVTGVLKIPASAIEKPGEIQGLENQFIKGIGKVEGRLLIILDVAKVISFDVENKRE